MSLKYHLVQKNNMSKDAASGAKLYYGQVRANERVKYEDLCTFISEYTLATDADVTCIIDALLLVMRRELAKGSIVEVGVLGNFRVTTGAPGVESEADFNTSMFRNGSIRYSPGPMLRELTKKARYEQIKFIIKDEECGREHIV